MPSAFISHSSRDDRYVNELEQFVRGLGYAEVFNDGHSIDPDAEFWKRIEDGIRACDAFVVVLSHASVNSNWVDREVAFARAEAKKILPIRIDDCTLPASFDGRDVIELREGLGERIKIAPSRILRHSPEHLFGREEWLDELDDAWCSRTVNIYALIAWGGAGKTSVIAHWVAKRLAAKGWPGVERYFDWSFYSQGARDQSQASADFFVAEALRFFGDPEPRTGGPWERGQRLGDLVRQHRTLLVLDGIEPLQYPPNSPQAGELKDEALAALLQGLAAHNTGLCIVTSRESLKNLEVFHGVTVDEKKLEKLTKEAAIGLLRHLQIAGTDEELTETWKDAGGHALTVALLGRFLADAHGGEIRYRKEVQLEEADRETPGRTAMKVLMAYEKWLESAGPDRLRDLAVLRLMGFFDRPATSECLAALRAPPAIEGLTDEIVSLTEPQWNKALKDLASLDLLTLVLDELAAPSHPRQIVAVDAHPLVREYFASELRKRVPKTFRTAHSRLFDQLYERTEYRPDDLSGLQPLYQAVTHGCLAGRHEEALVKVYVDRILRGTGPDGFYSRRKLGAVSADLAAVATFFDEPWGSLCPMVNANHQAWLFNEAAYGLRSLGRLTEALEPMRVSGEMDVKAQAWHGAAISYSNLSELEVMIGDLTNAVADGRRCIEFANLSESVFERMVNCTTAADALHQHGERTEARALFEEAERLQAERFRPQFPLLSSVPGFHYCDLILAVAEREAWRLVVVKTGGIDVRATALVQYKIEERKLPVTEALAACAEAVRRASEWRGVFSHEPSLLDIALDHLTLARASLYQAILSATGLPVSRDKTEPIRDKTFEALHGLRHAGAVNHVPKALLTAALFHHLREEPKETHHMLDEAQLIAERGPMPLYLVDIYLYRARMFGDLEQLTRARTLIDKREYGRRREELEDAEAVLL